MKKVKQTPAMKQYWNIKNNYSDSILLFRMGDFYETFDNDAQIASEILGITLTKRANGAASSVPLAGFPKHLHVVANNFSSVSIVPIPILPFAGLKPAFDIYLRTLLQVLLRNFGHASEKDYSMPLCFISCFPRISIFPRFSSG